MAKITPVPESKAGPKPQIMRIKVYSSAEVYFDRDAYSISAVNRTGPFDILPGHHNFMTLLLPCELVIRSDKTTVARRIRINQGIMHVRADRAVVFLDV
jgi:F0F1-type ATP synthase epsilon subunit